MILAGNTASFWSYTFLILGFATIGIQGQFSACPEEISSCCECVTRPGCGWTASSSDSGQPRCTSLLMSLPSSDSNPEVPRLVNDFTIRKNRPLNPHRKRFLRPQQGQLRMALGLRKEINIQVLARSRRVRLTIIGPLDAPEFSIEKGDVFSCSRRFRVRERTVRAGNGRGGGNASPMKKLSVDCHVSASGASQRLTLVVDMTKCYAGDKEIRVSVRESGARKFKLGVASSCECSCQSGDGSQNSCQNGEDSLQCSSPSTVEEEAEGINQCSGVNNNCRRVPYGPACSGHGTCICGVCMCDKILSGDEIHDPSIVLDETVPVPPLRYTGAHCQCDDSSCPNHQGRVCGGPERGICRCGVCVCNEDYLGAACDETSSEETCLALDGSVCNNQGTCALGFCQCNEGYSGYFCEICPSCPAVCQLFAPCVECLASGSVSSQTECSAVCDTFGTRASFTFAEDNLPYIGRECEIETASGCSIRWAYTDQSRMYEVYYQNELNCPPNRNS